MIRTVRGVSTLVGAGIAGLLIWISTQIGDGSVGGYWAAYGIVAGAGLTMALSQVAGGWTKWGWPRMSLGVFAIGFLPVLVVAGWILLSGQPDANWFQRHVASWSDDIGLGGLVGDLREYLGVIAFGLGLVLGLTLDTAGVERPAERAPVSEPAREPVPTETYPRAPVAPVPPQRERRREEQLVP